MSWESIIETKLKNKLNADNVWEVTNCVEHAAILGADELNVWAATPGFALGTYTVNVPSEDGVSEEAVHVNEIEILRSVVNSQTANSKAGIRINNSKYFLVNFDPENHTIYLKKQSGGAAIVRTATAIVFASFDNAIETGGIRSGTQNPGLCNEQVEKLAIYLKESGL